LGLKLADVAQLNVEVVAKARARLQQLDNSLFKAWGGWDFVKRILFRRSRWTGSFQPGRIDSGSGLFRNEPGSLLGGRWGSIASRNRRDSRTSSNRCFGIQGYYSRRLGIRSLSQAVRDQHRPTSAAGPGDGGSPRWR
jgi:hypothetical protein